jgi:cytosine/adenosine deaminase-related metal-dependent hydrolase
MHGWVVIVDGKIHQVTAQRPDVPHAIEINTHGIIFPGLIDLHNHLPFNVFPRWRPTRLFTNRYEWRQAPEYQRRVGQPYRVLSRRAFCDMNMYGEVRALVGGTTSILATAQSRCIGGLVRNLDHASGFYRFPEHDSRHIRAETDLPTDLSPIRSFLQDRRSDAFVVHVAEGDDVASRAEFDRLEQADLLTAKTVIVHGLALQRAQFQLMSRRGASLIWSPRSNIELYGRTTDVLRALDAGVKIALAPDWAVTGSSSVLDELRYAAAWNTTHLGGRLTNPQLVQMATSIPARIAGIADKVGSIQVGLYADLLVISGDATRPYEALLQADAGDVRLVLVNGVPLVGIRDLMTSLWTRDRLSPIEVTGTRMALETRDVQAVIDRLSRLLLAQQTQLAPLVEER